MIRRRTPPASPSRYASRAIARGVAVLASSALIAAATGAVAQKIDTPSADRRADTPGLTGITSGSFNGHGGPVRAVASHDGGRAVVTGGFDSAIIVWNLTPAFARQVLRHHDSTVNAIAALPGNCFASGGEDARIAVWCGSDDQPSRVLNGHTAPIAALAVSPDKTILASASWDHTIRLWPLDVTGSVTAGAPRIIEGHKGPVNGLAFTADGSALVSAGYDGQVRLTGLSARAVVLNTKVDAPVNAVAVSLSGEVVTAGADGFVRFLTAALEPAGAVDLGKGPLTTIALSPDGTRLATAGMRTAVTLIDAKARSVSAEILGPGLPVWSVAFSADGRELYTGGADRAVRRWDPATGRPAGVDIATAVEDVTANDPHPGARVFRACKACHGLDAADTNRAGPTLHGIMGRRIATQPGYAYSDALKRMDIDWTADTVARLFEVGPNAFLPGTKMPEQTITNPEDRKALVEWLASKTVP
ncbi:MAG: hypothetical protein CTY20_11150 [Hyphomicrobium sp.]|nr:MAG: hypothetical protein CTY20_11150 [Hyphomicrobium sp.]